MKIEPFGVERWIGKYEWKVPYDLAETSILPLTVRELLDLAGTDAEAAILDLRLDYGENPGSQQLREELAREHSVPSAENVLITHGAIEANALVYLALLEPGDNVIAMVPTYQQLYELPRFLGAKVYHWKLEAENHYRPDLELLQHLLENRAKLLILNSPNNPTGAALNTDELRQIARLAESNGTWVVSDEVYRGIAYDGEPVSPPLTELSRRAITVGSMSKVYALPGLRLGWIVGPKEVIEACLRFRDYLTISAPKISDALALLALRHRRTLLERNRRLMERNRAILLDWAARMEPRISVVPPKGGTTAFVGYDLDLPSEELGRILAEEHGVLVVPGACFGVERHFRLGYGCTTDVLIEGLQRIEKLVSVG
jgi:aspartate/methionine/tyrosine aminotransferase